MTINGTPIPDDAELLSRARAGDRPAFAQLVDRHKDALIRYLTRLTGSGEDAEDLAQETFLRLYMHRERYVERGQLTGYLYRIAVNLVRSRERQRKRRRLLRSVFLPTNGHGAAAPQQRQALGGEEQRHLRRALAELPLRLRVPLVLHEIEGLSYQEICALDGSPEGTVKSRIHRGRQLLRQKLTPYWNGEAHP